MFIRLRKFKNIGIVMTVMVMAFLAFSDMMPGHRAEASGYDSWVRNKESGNTTIDGVGVAPGGTAYQQMPEPSEDPVGSIQEKISETLMEINLPLGKIFKLGAVDASVTGIIMGHLTNSSGTSFFVFDLSDNNLYGVIGATIYVALRTLSLAFLFIFVLAKLIVTLYESDTRGLADMKEVVYGAIIVFFLLFIMPQVVDWVCTARNAIASYLYEKIQGMQVTTPEKKDLYVMVPGVNVTVNIDDVLNMSGMELTYYEMWENHKSILNAIIYFAAVVVLPLVWVISYIKIAIAQTVLFGVYPAFAVLSIRDRNLSSKWAVHFFTNAFVPVFDLMLIFIPAMIIQAIDSGDLVGTVLKAIITSVCFACIVPIRNQILSILGNQFGVRPNLGGAIALGAAALGALGAMVGGLSEAAQGAAGLSGGGTEGGAPSESDTSMADAAKNLDDIQGDMKNAAEAAAESRNADGTQNLDDVPTTDDAERYTGDTGQPTNEETEQNKDEAQATADHLNEMDGTRQDLNELNDENVVINGENGESFEMPQSEYEAWQESGKSIDEWNAAKETASDQSFGDNAKTSGSDQNTESDTKASTDGIHNDTKTEDFKEQTNNPMNDQLNRGVREDVPGVIATHNAQVTANDIRDRAGKFTKGAHNGEEVKRAHGVMENSKVLDGKLGKGSTKMQEFNAARLANLESMGNVQTAMRNADKSIAHENTSIAAYSKAIADNNAKISRLESQPSKNVADKSKAEAEISRLQASNATQRSNIAESQRRIAQYTEAKENLSDAYATHVEVEKGFASSSMENGFSDKTYKNASEFTKEVQAEANRVKAASYKDFKTEGLTGYLSAEDRMKIERDENIRRITGGLGKAAGAAAGLVGAVTVAGVASVAGEGAAATVLNAYGKKITNKGAEYGEKIGKHDDTVQFVSKDVPETYGNLKGGVKSVFESDAYEELNNPKKEYHS